MTDSLDDLLARLRPAWHAQAACRGSGADRFIVTTARATIDAKAVCAACPVITECLNYALADPTLRGVWGAQSSRDRARTRAASTSPRAPRPRPDDGDTPRSFGREVPADGCGAHPPPKADRNRFEPSEPNERRSA